MTASATFCAPAWEHIPEHVGTYGPEVADLADAAGMTLFPEQRMALDVMYAHDARGRLVATEFGCAAPRRNIKSHVGKAAALADLVLFKEPDCLWTAQLRATSDDIFANDKGTGLAQIFENYDFLRRMLDGEPKNSDGEQVIRLRRPRAGAAQPTLKFMARSERGGRGLDGTRVTYDEALFLKPSMTSAMIPVLSAASITGNVQVRYLGSPGRLESAKWREIRDRGRRGDQPRMAWLEWAAPHEPCDLERCPHTVGTEGCALDRPHLIRAANLALDRLIDLDFVMTTERQALQPPSEFACERMGWWQDPPNAGGGALDVERWKTFSDVDALPVPPLSFGVDVGEDRLTTIATAWRRSDGAVQVMVTQEDQLDVALAPAVAVARLAELRKRWNGTVWLGGPATGLDGDLAAVGVDAGTVSGTEFAMASGRFADLLTAGEIHHGGQRELTDAVRAAQWRAVGAAGERAFQLKDMPGIGPLAAGTRALHGLTTATDAPPNLW